MIETEEQYKKALEELKPLFQEGMEITDWDGFFKLLDEIATYENTHCPVADSSEKYLDK